MAEATTQVDPVMQQMAAQAAQQQAPITYPQLPQASPALEPTASGYQAPTPARQPLPAQAQAVVNALRLAAMPGLGTVPQATVHPAYTAPPPNLNPNLAKAAARIQQLTGGVSKPNSADWGR